jgi:uncharacterized protein (TIGR02246 family)
MTRLVLPLVALALLVAPAAFAASKAATEAEAVERARFQTWVKGDVTAMKTVMADDVLYCHSSGQCQNKQEFIAEIESKQRVYKKMDVLSLTAKALGSYAVLINGTIDVVGESSGKTVQFRGIYTSVYVRRDGHWQLISWQSTTLP